MNATVIDIPGITVSVTPLQGEHTVDTSYLITIKDQSGEELNIGVAYGKINFVR